MKILFEIKKLDNTYVKQIVDLILPIQQVEFNVPVTFEAQPDLLDVEGYYIQSGGSFWGAIANKELIGTIALIAIGHNAGAIRKMFVKKEFRGKEFGVAQQLLDELIFYSINNDINNLMLGTVDMLKAAHRFYEKNGFKRHLDVEMPEYFPRMMGENVYYRLSLGSYNSKWQ